MLVGPNLNTLRYSTRVVSTTVAKMFKTVQIFLEKIEVTNISGYINVLYIFWYIAALHLQINRHARYFPVASTSPHDEEQTHDHWHEGQSPSGPINTLGISLATNQLNPRALRTVFYCDLGAPLFEYICIYCNPIAYTEPSGP